MQGEVYRCAWCGKRIRSGAAVYGLGVKLREGLEYPGGVGRVTSVELPLHGRSFQCMVTADDSQARLEGWDLIFMLCGEDCGSELREVLREEEGLFEAIM